MRAGGLDFAAVSAIIFAHYRLAFLSIHNLYFVHRLLLFARYPSLSNLEYLEELYLVNTY